MSRPNVHGLPQHLRKDENGFYLDYCVETGGLKKRKRVRLGHISTAQAKKIWAENAADLANQKYLESERPKASFRQAAESFLAFSKARKKSHRRDVFSVRHLVSFFGDRDLESLTPSTVEDYLAFRQKEANQKGRPLAGSTLNREIACLKTIVRRAMLDRLIDRNPIERGIRFFREKSRNRTLSPQEYQRLLDHCSPHMRAIVILAYDTGMRRSEVLGLKWEQVDLKDGIINLMVGETKTYDGREIPLDGPLQALLASIPKTLGSPYVFTYRGHRLKDPKTAFLKACRRARIQDFRFHDLRHCAVTNFRKAGVSDSTIMSISGHKTYAVFRRYDRIDREDRLKALERVRSTHMEANKTPIRHQPDSLSPQVVGQ